MLNYSASPQQWQGDAVDVADQEHLAVGANPFPGLRPFTIDESHLFFGREGQVDDILVKLDKNRCVTVMGYSGSGKSSLMYCGLVPILYGGFMTETGPNWQIITTRPGISPIATLANSLVNFLVKSKRIGEDDRLIQRAIISSVLRSGPQGLVEVSRFIQSDPAENICILIDQFEELFRYRDDHGEESLNEATLFVNLILQAVAQKDVPVYIALSMRSDFIGDCATYPGLTQVINSSNYIVPQMTREQRRMAIEGPAAVGGGRISQRLVKKLLGDIGDNQDTLPIMQHALMRTWNYWVENREPGEPMDIRHYNAVGKIAQALSMHANEAFDELSTKGKEIAEILFKNITEKNSEDQGMRRPGRVREIAELAETTEAEVIGVIDHFRQPGRSFLMPSAHVPLTGDSLVELSHESMMRIWTRLTAWADEEFESSRMYKRISEAAAMYQIGRTGLWRPPDLQLALNWQKKQKPTRTWAKRYDDAFERAIVFLDTSRITQEAELKNQELMQRRMLRRARITNVVLGIAFLIAMLFFFFGLIQQIEAENQAKRAEANEKAALEAKAEAESQRKIAEDKSVALEKANNDLTEAYLKVEQALEQANIARAEALRNLNRALEQERIAEAAQVKEKDARIEAEKQTQIARENFNKANRLLYLSVAQSMEAKAEIMDDPQMAGLLAMQGYLFHTRYEGKKYDPYVFSGLYYSLAKISGLNYNEVKYQRGVSMPKNRMYALAISQSGDNFFTTGNDGRVFQGNIAKLSIDAELGSNAYPNRVLALSRDEKYLVVGTDSATMQIYTIGSADKPKPIIGHRGFINDIKFLPDNSGFISTGVDKTIRFTNHVNGQSRSLLTLPFDLKAIDISTDGQWLVGASLSGKLVRVNLKDNSFSVIKDESPNRILSVAIHPLSQRVAYGLEIIEQQLNEKGEVKPGFKIRGLVKILELVTGRTKELTGHKAGVSDIEFSPDGLLLASAGLDKKLQMWVVDHESDLPIVMANNNGNIWDIGFAKGSDYLLASCNNGEIRVWPTDPKILAELVCPKLTRNMTTEEWETYVDGGFDEIPYETTCKSLTISDF